MKENKDIIEQALLPQGSEELAPGAGDKQFWDAGVSAIRNITPAIIVNNGSRLNFALKAAADVMSISSCFREKVDAKLLNDITDISQKQKMATHLLEQKQTAAAALWESGEYSQLLSHKWNNMSAKYRFVASCITLGAVGLGVIYKEKPLTREERESYRSMPLSEYIPLRIRHGFDPANHIAATYGLTAILNGGLKAMQGIQQTAKLGSKKGASMEMMQGLLTMAAGGAMSFIPDQEDAWQYSTLLFLGRAPFAGLHAHTAYYKGYPGTGIPPGDWQQGAQFILNQSSNIFSFFYGGVKKLPDGSIIYLKDKKLEQKAASEPELADIIDGDAPPVIVAAKELKAERLKVAEEKLSLGK